MCSSGMAADGKVGPRLLQPSAALSGPSSWSALGVGLSPTQTSSKEGKGIALMSWLRVPALRREIAALTEQVDELSRLARTDPLTGLANRRGWDEQLERELAQSRRSGRPVSVALLDLDDFKGFNDAHGHQAGDRLLVAAAAAWRLQLRDGDVLCRWGGDEFAVLFPDCSNAEAHEVVARVTPTTPRSQSCAAGIATWDGTETSDELVYRADAELLKPKHARVVA
jgi:diguanylate cyclase (GGDEF)-like protein